MATVHVFFTLDLAVLEKVMFRFIIIVVIIILLIFLSILDSNRSVELSRIRNRSDPAHSLIMNSSMS